MGRQTEIEIVNVICIGEDEFLWDDLPEEKQSEYRQILTERMMRAAGYVRRPV